MRKVTLMKKPFMERYYPDTVPAEFALQISRPCACLSGGLLEFKKGVETDRPLIAVRVLMEGRGVV